MKTYLIDSSCNHTKGVGDILEPIISRAMLAYDGPEDNIASYEYQTRVLLCDLLHRSHINVHGGDLEGKWLPLPLANADLLKKHPEIVMCLNKAGSHAGLGYTRITDLLAKQNVIKIRKYIKGQRCTTIRFNPRLLVRLEEAMLEGVPKTHQEYLDIVRPYNIMNPNSIYTKDAYRRDSWTAKLSYAVRKGMKRPKHDFSKLRGANGEVRQPKDVVKRYEVCLSKLEPIEFNFTALTREIARIQQQANSAQNRRDRRHFLSRCLSISYSLDSILKQGVDSFYTPDSDDRWVRYYPQYSVVPKGGRMFEVGGGFQNIPGDIKSSISRSHNWDLKSSQLTILSDLCGAYAIKVPSYLASLSVDEIAEKLSIDRPVVKVILYGTIFLVDKLATTPYNEVYRYLKDRCGFSADRATKVVNDWNLRSHNMIRSIRELSNHLATLGKHHRSGVTFTNAVGLCYCVPKERLKDDKTLQRREIRQLAAHVIQGIETEYILQSIEAGARIQGIEHDGFVGECGAIVKMGTMELERKW